MRDEYRVDFDDDRGGFGGRARPTRGKDVMEEKDNSTSKEEPMATS